MINGKFRSILAVLFGAGICLQFVKRWEAGAPWPGTYLRRVGLLAVLGLVHGILMWYGDILWVYSWLALATLLLAKVVERKQRVLIWIGVGIAALLGALSFLGGFFGDGSAGMPGMGDEARIFAQGAYVEQLAFRFRAWTFLSLFHLVWVPCALPLFLFGFLLARHGVLTKPQDHLPLIRRMALVGFGVGLPLNLVVLVFWPKGNMGSVQGYVEILAGPVLSIGYASALLLIVAHGTGGAVVRQLALVGRMALSNYLLQTVLCTSFYYSWGGGMFDRLGPIENLGVVVGVWAINIAFTNLWLAKFQIGPVEWLWRSASEGRRFPILRAPVQPESAA